MARQAFKNRETGNVFYVADKEEGARISRLPFIIKGYVDDDGKFRSIEKSVEDELRAEITDRDAQIAKLEAKIAEDARKLGELNELKKRAAEKGDKAAVADLEDKITDVQNDIVTADSKRRAIK